MRKMTRQLVDEVNAGSKKEIFLGHPRRMIYKVIFELRSTDNQCSLVWEHWVDSETVLYDNYWEARKYSIKKGENSKDFYTLRRARLKFG